MTRHSCHTCEVLKEIYWLKASRFVVAVRSASHAQACGRSSLEQDVQTLNDDAMNALRTLLRHVNTCYGFTLEKAA